MEKKLENLSEKEGIEEKGSEVKPMEGWIIIDNKGCFIMHTLATLEMHSISELYPQSGSSQDSRRWANDLARGYRCIPVIITPKPENE